MTNFELRDKMTEYTKEYEKVVSESINRFILNPKAHELTQKMYELREQCTHEFVDGKCIYCGMEE